MSKLLTFLVPSDNVHFVSLALSSLQIKIAMLLNLIEQALPYMTSMSIKSTWDKSIALTSRETNTDHLTTIDTGNKILAALHTAVL